MADTSLQFGEESSDPYAAYGQKGGVSPSMAYPSQDPYRHYAGNPYSPSPSGQPLNNSQFLGQQFAQPPQGFAGAPGGQFYAQQQPGNPYANLPSNAPSQQPRTGAPPPFNPNILGNLDSNLATQFGIAYGTHALEAGQNYINSNLKRYIDIPMLKYYFDVSNSYVATKLRLILFPFTKKSWEREVMSNPQGAQVGFLSPRHDVNAPDLYIPLMAFITFVLLLGIEQGQNQAFTPEVLGMTASTGFGVTVFEFLAIKLGCYLLNIPSENAFLDLIAYTGYKYVSMIVCLAVRILFGSQLFTFCFIYTNLALAFFLLRTLGASLGAGSNQDAMGISPQRKRRNYFLLAIAAQQVITTYFLL